MDATGLKFRDYLLALILFVVSFAALGLAQRNLGVMRDEATYFHAAESYWHWFEEFDKKDAKPLTKASISRWWKFNNEHPVLLKTLFGASWRAFRTTNSKYGKRAGIGNGLGWMSEISAFRLPGWFFTALCVALIYLFGCRIESRVAGLTAALLYISIPRVFFHGQLAAFDSAMTTMWLLVVYGYFRALDKARWAFYAAIFFGLALSTKHNAWFIPALLLIHYLVTIWPDVSLSPLRLPRAPLVFILMAIVGPIIFYLHWPWLWFDTFDHLKFYFNFHLRHAYYNMEFLGVNWGLPPLPMSYPFVMTFFTIPVVLTVLSLIGVAFYFRYPLQEILSRWTRIRSPQIDERFRYPAKRSWLRPAKGLDPKIGFLLILNATFPLVLIALPSTPIFGGTKHWLPAYPFIALLAGIALSRMLANLSEKTITIRIAASLLIPIVALPGIIGSYQIHPFGLSQYNAAAGGTAGGAELGLNRQFWGYAPRQLLPWLNQSAPKNTRIYYHDMSDGARVAYIRDGLLRNDLPYSGYEEAGIRRSNIAMVIHELHFNKYDYWIWNAYKNPAPIQVLAHDGVPLVSVYARKNLGLAPFSRKEIPPSSKPNQTEPTSRRVRENPIKEKHD